MHVMLNYVQSFAVMDGSIGTTHGLLILLWKCTVVGSYDTFIRNMSVYSMYNVTVLNSNCQSNTFYTTAQSVVELKVHNAKEDLNASMKLITHAQTVLGYVL